MSDRPSEVQLRLLVAEDNQLNQTVLLAMLNKLGYAADGVANGVEAVAAVRAVEYSLVLMDCEMPEMDGFEATRQIRSSGAEVRNPNLPVIAVSAKPEHRDECRKAGMNGYLLKPIFMKDLEEIIKAWITG